MTTTADHVTDLSVPASASVLGYSSRWTTHRDLRNDLVPITTSTIPATDVAPGDHCRGGACLMATITDPTTFDAARTTRAQRATTHSTPTRCAS
jgi:hypothetical protein